MITNYRAILKTIEVFITRQDNVTISYGNNTVIAKLKYLSTVEDNTQVQFGNKEYTVSGIGEVYVVQGSELDGFQFWPEHIHHIIDNVISLHDMTINQPLYDEQGIFIKNNNDWSE